MGVQQEYRAITSTGELRASLSRLTRILEISEALTSTLDLEPLLQQILVAATELTETEAASIMLHDERAGDLRFVAASNNQELVRQNIRVPIEDSIAGTIFTTRQPMLIENADNDPRHNDQVDQKIDFQTRSILGVPLLIKDRATGVVEVVNKVQNVPFSSEDIQVLSTLAAHAAVAIENAQLVNALRKAYQKLNDLDKLKSNFIAIASHELRTPLALILGYASMIKEESGDKSDERLDRVIESSLRLRGLIEDMVNLRHIEAGDTELELATFDVREMVQTICTDCESLSNPKEQTIVQRVPPTPLPIYADRGKLSIALTNLLLNAIKYTPNQGQIEVSVEARGSEIRVSVADSGPGIPTKELEPIFERFHQIEGHMTRKQGGLGLGLPIARSMVELHNGRMWAESKLGHGSRFTFTLPIREEA
jgi:signal transduction histidine kinase